MLFQTCVTLSFMDTKAEILCLYFPCSYKEWTLKVWIFNKDTKAPLNYNKSSQYDLCAPYPKSYETILYIL